MKANGMTMTDSQNKGDKRFASEVHRRQYKKNLAVLAALVAFCVLIYLISIARMSGG